VEKPDLSSVRTLGTACTYFYTVSCLDLWSWYQIKTLWNYMQLALFSMLTSSQM